MKSATPITIAFSKHKHQTRSRLKFSSSQRRIHARRFADVELMHRLRGRMLFNRRVARELLAGASKTLALAKAEHDTLESYYINAMDFDAVSQYAEQMSNEILK